MCKKLYWEFFILRFLIIFASDKNNIYPHEKGSNVFMGDYMKNKVCFEDLFPDNRREGETTLRQAQFVMLRMLKVIDYICRKHGIQYWLCSGTLLGAVRHKGFIPWDDDLDISMLREDYERFLEVAEAELPDDMMLQTRKTDPHYHYLPLPCKIRDRKSFTLSPGYEDEACEKGLFVDIFPTDRYHTNRWIFGVEKLLKRYNRFICKCLDSIYFTHESPIRKILAHFYPLFHFLVKRYQKFVRKFINRNQGGTDCFIGAGWDTPWIRYIRYEELMPLSEMAFEDGMFYVPRNAGLYLETIYGADYMTPPPEDQRSRHASVLKPIL
ncbi:MAG: LicD family protein [Tannerellaceae bacterium]|nr:LicD family protein [Tannerellaceae bacterium]